MELKQVSVNGGVASQKGSNRTFMELKRSTNLGVSWWDKF